jgi:hypothetical protein
MQALISLTLLVVGLVIVMGKHDDALKKAAFGWIGAVIGYWLK